MTMEMVTTGMVVIVVGLISFIVGYIVRQLMEKPTSKEGPQSAFTMSEMLCREIQEISGVNEELLGSAVDDKSPALSSSLKGSIELLGRKFDKLSAQIRSEVRMDHIVKHELRDKPSKVVARKKRGRPVGSKNKGRKK